MDDYINRLMTKLDEEDISDEEAKKIFNMIQIANKTEETNLDVKIKKAEVAKKTIEIAEADAEVNKLKAETKAAKIDKFVKIGGLVLTGGGLIVGGIMPIILNDRNNESHKESEMQYSPYESHVEKTTLSKSIDFLYSLINKALKK